MFNLVRSFISNRRAARRILSALPVRFSIVRQSSASKTHRSRSIAASTTDISRSGLAISTSVIQIDNFHISMSSDMTSEQFLDIELTLPELSVHIEGRPLRYDRRESEAGGYLVGVQIMRMSDEDRLVYEEYLKHPVR